VLELRGAAAPGRSEPRKDWPGENDTAAILFTSGTTGTPKGVTLSHRNLVADCYLSQANLRVLPTDVFYALMPIHHSYTMTAVFLICVSSGAEVLFGQKMVSKHILEDLKRGRVTMFLGVPMLFNRLLIGIRKGLREKGLAAFALIRGLMLASGLVKKLFRVNPGKKMFGFLLKKVSLENIRICISGGGPLPARAVSDCSRCTGPDGLSEPSGRSTQRHDRGAGAQMVVSDGVQPALPLRGVRTGRASRRCHGVRLPTARRGQFHRQRH
jgi:long-chain acyl-CoA synthetase